MSVEIQIQSNDSGLVSIPATEVMKTGLCKASKLKEEPSDLKINVLQHKPFIERYDDFRKKLFKGVSETAKCTVEETKKKTLSMLLSKFALDVQKLEMSFERMDFTLTNSTDEGDSMEFPEGNELHVESTTPMYPHSVRLEKEPESVKETVSLQEKPIVNCEKNKGKMISKCIDKIEVGTFKCIECNARFKTIHILQNHFDSLHMHSSILPSMNIAELTPNYTISIQLQAEVEAASLPIVNSEKEKDLPIETQSTKLDLEYMKCILCDAEIHNENDYICNNCECNANIRLEENADAVKDTVLPILTSDDGNSDNIVTETSKGEEPTGQTKLKFKCIDCKTAFQSMSALQIHFDKLHGSQFICNICDKVFQQEIFYKRHVADHSVPSVYYCEYCLAYFAREINHRQHMRTHEIDLSVEQQCELKKNGFIRCNICDMVFCSEDIFKIHLTYCKQQKHKTSLQNAVEQQASLQNLTSEDGEFEIVFEEEDLPVETQSAILDIECNKCILCDADIQNENDYICNNCEKGYHTENSDEQQLAECNANIRFKEKADTVKDTVLPIFISDDCHCDNVTETSMGEEHTEQAKFSAAEAVKDNTVLPILISDDCDSDNVVKEKSKGEEPTEQTKFKAAEAVNDTVSPILTFDDHVSDNVVTETSKGDEPTDQTKLKFKCIECKAAFQSMSALQIHFDKIHSKWFVCDVCDKVFQHEIFYKRHMCDHSVRIPFYCEYCLVYLTREINYTQHIRKHEIDLSVEQQSELNKNGFIRCNICDNVFHRGEIYKIHLPYCKHHVKQKHEASLKNTGQQQASLQNLTVEEQCELKENGFISCNICDEVFRKEENYRIHIANHTVPNSYRCEDCLAYFSHERYCKHHVKQKRETSLQNTVEQQLSLQNLTVEEQCELKKNSFISCSKGEEPTEQTKFAAAGTVKDTVLPILISDDCGSDNVVNEMRKGEVPTEQIKFKAAEAVNDTVSPILIFDYFNSHNVVTETSKGQEPTDQTKHKFKCIECKAAFQSMPALQIHFDKIHNKWFTCDVCDKVFQHERFYKRHMFVHSVRTAFYCEYCQAYFEREINHRQHMRKHEIDLSVEQQCELKNNGFIKCNICDKVFCREGIYKIHVMYCKHDTSYQNAVEQQVSLRNLTVEEECELKKNGFIICKICDKVYHKEKHYRIHVAKHSVPSPYRCEYCLAYFSHERYCKLHVQRKHETSVQNLTVEEQCELKKNGFITCNICDKVYHMVDYYKEHMAMHSVPSEYTCQYCRVHFSCEAHYKKHIKKMHNRGLPICNICNTVFRSQLNYDKHVASHRIPSAYRCEYCLVYFTSKETFRRHISLKHKARTQTITVEQKSELEKNGCISCNSCDKIYHSEKSYKRHLANEHRYKQQCEICGKIFGSMWALRAHLQRHTGDYSHKCGVCGKGFNMSCLLKWHMDFHMNVKRFSCDICHKKFRSPSARKMHHNQIHLNIRLEYKCVVCEHVSGSKQSLKFHMNTHTGDTPFKCNFCPKSFATPSSMSRHIRIHQPEKAEPCSLCGKKFIHLSSLRDHMLMHYGVKRYECNLCDKKFVKKITITKHMQRHAENGDLGVAEDK